MNEAENYHDFTLRLVERACSEDGPQKVIYLAVRHAVELGLFDTIETLSEKFSNVDILQPYFLGSLFFRSIKEHSEVIDSIDHVLSVDLDDWISIELLNYRSAINYYSIKYEDSMKDSQRAEELARKDTELECLTPPIYAGWSVVLHTLGNLEKAQELAEKAVQVSEKYDDILAKGNAFSIMTLIFKDTDITRAIAHANKAQRIYEELGFQTGLADLLNILGLISEIIGEYNQAIECYKEAIDLYTAVGIHPTVIPTNLARVYLNTGQSIKSVEILEKIVNKSANPAHTHITMAQALVACGRLDEATEHLDSGQEHILNSGREALLANYYITRGMLEKAKGDFPSAVRSFKQALRIAEKHPFLLFRLKALVHLAEAEVFAFSRTNAREHIENADILLSRIDQLAREQNLFGVITQVAILKADIQKAEGHKDKAREILDTAIKLCESSAMKSLKLKVQETIENLEVDEPIPAITERFSNQILNLNIPSVRAKELPFTVLGCIVMLREAGLEVYSKYVDKKLTSDPSLVAGLISAVSSFTHELREDGKGELQSIIHQDIAVLLEHGKHVTFALLTDKDTYNARALQLRFLEQFEKEFSDELAKCSDGVAQFMAADELFDSVFEERTT